MPKTFQELYDAKPFDSDSRDDQIGEIGRQLVLKAALGASVQVDELTVEEITCLLCGMLVAVVQVGQSSLTGPGDEVDVALRKLISMNTAWAVDMARSCEGKDPLPEADEL